MTTPGAPVGATPPTARKCDICGRGANQKQGGVIPFAGFGYAHLKCFRKRERPQETRWKGAV